MKLDALTTICESIHPGSFFRVCYETEVPVKAAFKKQGYRIYKHTEVTSRTGVGYKNIEGVVLSEDNNHTNNYQWVKKNMISYNTSTGKYYFNIYPTENGKRYVEYVIQYNGVGDIAPLNEIVDMVIPSYFNKSGTSIKKQTINIDNIKWIKYKDEIMG